MFRRRSLPILLLSVLAALSLLSIRFERSPRHAFYYWKTEWSASPEIATILKTGGIDRLYMRFFDVEWDAAKRAPHPVAPLKFQSPAPHIEIVPVVYLVNAVFLKIDYDDVPKLVDDVWGLVTAMATRESVTFQELQLDCDWSEDSQRNYFRFVDLLHMKMQSGGKSISATLRLHQVKYVQRTGIPPVDRGMLMFYNFRQIQADEPGHSIFNEEDAARYTSYIAGYPLNLDVVLPMFSWSVHAREGRVLGLLEGIGHEAAEFDGFREAAPDRYTATRSFFFRGRYFMDGDVLLVEETTPDITKQAAALAKRGAGWRKDYGTVALFDLDEKHLNVYTGSVIRSILGQF